MFCVKHFTDRINKPIIGKQTISETIEYCITFASAIIMLVENALSLSRTFDSQLLPTIRTYVHVQHQDSTQTL